MGLRTSGVRGGSTSSVPNGQELFNQNIDIGSQVSFPAGEYGNNQRGLYPRANDFDEAAYNPVVQNDQLEIMGGYKDETIGNINSIPAEPPAGAPIPDAVDPFGGDTDYPKDPAATSKAKNLRLAAAGIEAVGGIVNAYAKNANYVTANNLKIMQIQQQQNFTQSEASRAMLRQGTISKERKGEALINAIAQGQDPSGDLAKTALTNEDIYAAQNVRNIQVNLYRNLFTLNSEIATAQTNSKLSAINRDREVAQHGISLAQSVALAGV